MSHQGKASKHHLGKGLHKGHEHPHKHDKYNIHKLSVVVSHNKFERDHGGESAKLK
ncbi:MAG: hypothetical protein JWM37_541 [Candidatus Saccharibacteria bacterium]|nr:hypothetical protein [Candidatus Saccharibacteria bacterium]